MSLARAIATGDVALLPSRRDEDWRWTDLRGLIRQMPAPAPAGQVWGPGLFSQAGASRSVEIVNGRGPTSLALADNVLELRLIADGEGASSATLAITVSGAAVLLESYETSGDCLANFDLDITLAEGASLQRVILCEGEDEAVLVSQAVVRLAPGARLEQTVITAGGRRQRLETRVSHPGAGALARLDGVYVAGDRRHCDITTEVVHAGVGGETDQLVKGVVADQARAVFQGRVVVEPGADRTDARMGHHALLLSDRAEVDAKPELLIHADDVACAHGNTVGALDEDALFYARQRGIPEAAARAMLTRAFLAEVVDRVTHDGAREVAEAWLDARLGGDDGV